uniref:Uncharacterized protein n=1 Tax=Dermatophagoides pteronyssinus TaxID=6956 RepID=A0A6P6YGD7_DERPT|nr:putative uncharacterized protein DDB_G0286901 isoform X2 [Dermatophagoides pteronyssinus]
MNTTLQSSSSSSSIMSSVTYRNYKDKRKKFINPNKKMITNCLNIDDQKESLMFRIQNNNVIDKNKMLKHFIRQKFNNNSDDLNVKAGFLSNYHHHHHHQYHQKRPSFITSLISPSSSSSSSNQPSSILILIIMTIMISLFSHNFVVVFGQQRISNHHHPYHQNVRILQTKTNNLQQNQQKNMIKDFHMKKISNIRSIRPLATFIVKPKNLLPSIVQNNSDTLAVWNDKSPTMNITTTYQLVKKNKKKTKMSPNLKQFSDLNVDLMFEDSFDVNTTHYNETYGDDYDMGENLGTVIMPLDSSESNDGPTSIILPPPNSYQTNNNRFFNQQSNNDNQPEHSTIAKSNEVNPRLKMLMMTKLVEPKTNKIIYTNYYNGSNLYHPNQYHQSSDLVSINTPFNSNTQTFVDEQNPYHTSKSGDHVLRPFMRRTNTARSANNHNDFNHLRYPQKSDTQHRNKNDNELHWSVPVIELKRLTRTETSTKPTNQSVTQQSTSGRMMTLTTASPLITNHPIDTNQRDQLDSHQRLMMFHKRLPLLSNDEGFILTKPNVTDANMVEIIENNSMINKRDDSFNNDNNISNNRNEFKRRFGEIIESSRGRNFNSFKMNNNNNMNNRGLSAEDVSINDLEMDDEFKPSRLKNNNNNNNNMNNNNNNNNNGGSGQNNFHPKNINNNNNNNHNNNHNQPSIQQQQPPQSQNQVIFNPGITNQGFPPTLHQMMPLFFDKFMAQLSNGPPLHSNHIDNDIGDLDAPLERRLNGGKPLVPVVQPPSSKPIFVNEILPTGNEFDANFPTIASWPKIFRFTDGRINLHDFEREKKRSRIKFSHKMGKSHALFNIKRDSFLILHGGTFNQ